MPEVRIQRSRKILGLALLGLAALAAALAFGLPRIIELLAAGEVRQLRPDRPAPTARSATERPRLLILAFDGIGRDLLYGMLKKGDLPAMAQLLGGGEGLPHAWLEPRMLSVLPSTTLLAWATVFTGAPPAVHGVTGNEFFVRGRAAMEAPAPVSLDDLSPAIAVYTDGYANALLEAPTVYEQMREREPDLHIWVSMSQFFRGADKLLLARRSAFSDTLVEFFQHDLPDERSRAVYAELDEEVGDTVVDELRDSGVPDVLTIYFSGSDLFAHNAHMGPDQARREYLAQVLDPALGGLREALAHAGMLEDCFVVVVSDHGHTDVLHDDAHALSAEGEDEPPQVLRGAGFRVREAEWRGVREGFQAVLAYQGAVAYVSLADRSTCPDDGDRCDWTRPPRFVEDVVPAAEAFRRAAEGQGPVSGMKGAIDLILARTPGDGSQPFQVYTGDGRLVPVDRYLAAHPHPAYVEVESRLRDLAVGPRGDRAGDLLLLANNGNVASPGGRYYFAKEYRSWHGSPSRNDSEVPLVVAHRGWSREALRQLVTEALGEGETVPQTRVTPLLLRLRQ